MLFPSARAMTLNFGAEFWAPLYAAPPSTPTSHPTATKRIGQKSRFLNMPPFLVSCSSVHEPTTEWYDRGSGHCIPDLVTSGAQSRIPRAALLEIWSGLKDLCIQGFDHKENVGQGFRRKHCANSYERGKWRRGREHSDSMPGIIGTCEPRDKNGQSV